MCFIDKKRCVVAVTDFCDRLQITAKTVVRRADQKYGFRIRRFREGFSIVSGVTRPTSAISCCTPASHKPVWLRLKSGPSAPICARFAEQ